MTTYTSVFGNEAIPQSDSSYAAVQLSANTTFFWPTQASGPSIISDIMDVTPTGAYAMTMPPANQVSVGREVLVRNMGSHVITLHGSLGATLGTVSPGETKFLYIVDNSTVAGVWRIVAMGTGVSAPDAAVLAGNGLRAVSSTLNQESLTVSSATSSSVMLSNLASTFVYVASGAVVCSLLSAMEATNGFFFNVSNQGTGQVTIDPFGVQLIDGEIYKVLAPGESATVVCTGLTWVTIGHGRSTQFQFTKLVLDITSGSPFTLTSTQAQNKLIEFIGALSADAVINLPSVTAVYYTECSYTGVFNVTVKTAVGTGIVLQPNERSILYCDGMNVVMAQTANVPVVNITGGVAGALPYQAAPDTTSFTSAGMLGDVLRSAGTAAPTWQNPNEFLVQKSAITGSALLPSGSTPQRDTTPLFGMLRGNTDTGFIEYWSGTGWNPIDGTAVMHEENFTATEGQVTFVLAGPYVVGVEALTVYINGLEQGNAAYTEVDTHTITFTEGLAAGDYVEVRWGTAEFLATADAATTTYLQAGAGAVPGTVQKKLREEASITDFGATGNEVDDASDAFALAAAESDYIHVPKGDFRITRPLSVPNLRSMTGAPGSRIILDTSIGDNYAFTRNSGSLVSDVTTIVTTASFGDSVVTVVDASAITPGTYLRLKSDEYFHGIAGVPGFGISTKGEYVQVIAKTGNVLTLAEPLRDTYFGALYPVRVSLKTFGESLAVSGLEVVYDGGIGGGGSDLPLVSKFFAVRSVKGVSIFGNNCHNLPSVNFFAGYCLGVSCTGNSFAGPDLALPVNLPEATDQWGKGLELLSSQGIIFTENKLTNLRRGVDPATATADVICRDIINSDNHVIDCSNMIGGHTFQNYVASGNTGSAIDMAYLRGKDITLSNNICQCSGTIQGIGIGGGVPDGVSYTEDFSNGVITLRGNTVHGDFDTGVRVRGGVTAYTSEGNWVGNCSQYGVSFSAKSIKNVRIQDTYRGIPTNGTALTTSYAVAFLNPPTLPIESMDGVSVSVATSGKFHRGVGIIGTASGVGASRIYVGDCSFEHLVSHMAVFSPVTGDGLGDKGCFSGQIRLGPMYCANSDATMTINAPGEGGHWPIIASYWGKPGETSHELAYYDAATQAGTTQGGAARTYLRGARKNFYNPVAGGYLGHVCLSSGTSGTLAGCTGSITAGSSGITINNAALVSPGAFISIAGAGTAGAALAAQVTAKTGAVLTINTTAVTTVASAAVTWTPSVWRGYGLIAV